jgi:hypothetical protein
MDLEKLQDAVERAYGKRVVNRPDCEELSITIFKKSKLLISYNTLRRFFGLAGQKNNSTVSKATLDVLAIYCGFQSYFDFCTQLESIDNLGKLYKVQLEVVQQNPLDLSTIEQCLSQFENNEHLYSLMNYITVVAFKKGDIAFLKQLFTIQRVFNGDHYLHPHLYYLIQTIGVQVQSHPEIATELWKSWAQDTKARFYYFELFVDMCNLIQSHYIGIEFYLAHTKEKQAIIFATSLLTWRFLLLNDLARAKEQFISEYTLEDLCSIHPIPAARFLNNKLLMEYLDNGTVSADVQEEIATVFRYFEKNTHPFFEHFICEGLVITGYYELALFYIRAANKKVQMNLSFYLIGSNERFKILESYCLMRIGEQTASRSLKEGVQLELLDSFSASYDSVFYYAIDPEPISNELKAKFEALGYLQLARLLGLRW